MLSPRCDGVLGELEAKVGAVFSPLCGRGTTGWRQVCSQHDRHTALEQVICRGPRLDILQLRVEESVGDVPTIECEECIQSMFFDRESGIPTVFSCRDTHGLDVMIARTSRGSQSPNANHKFMASTVLNMYSVASRLECEAINGQR